jgi:hypothetical protein
MEGIHYDAEKEDVTLVSIKDENGGEYHSDKAGTYIATYMVVPKDKSDSYTITRKVTLTDTEGQAHSEENGGEKQKSDTESEDDSDSPVQNYTDVEIEKYVLHKDDILVNRTNSLELVGKTGLFD